jgi:hypothetical protein
MRGFNIFRRNLKFEEDMENIFYILRTERVKEWGYSIRNFPLELILDTQGLQSHASRTGLFSPLDLSLPNLLPSPREKRWPISAQQTSSKDIWSGDFHSSPIHSNTCIEVTSGVLALRIWTLSDSFKITCSGFSLYNYAGLYEMCCGCSGCSFKWTLSEIVV